ncbi:MAG: rplX [Fibrobacteria bacterium]|jgi:large subunit ribosomal protein L24|nr:rplX [Fibrobacteria bacterium]
MSLNLKKNDTVKVISGKARGKTGRILRVLTLKNTAIVEGLNLVKKHQRPTQQDQKGGIVEREAPIHLSNLMLVNKSNEPVKVVRRVVDGKRVRVEKKTGKAVD